MQNNFAVESEKPESTFPAFNQPDQVLNKILVKWVLLMQPNINQSYDNFCSPLTRLQTES